MVELIGYCCIFYFLFKYPRKFFYWLFLAVAWYFVILAFIYLSSAEWF